LVESTKQKLGKSLQTRSHAARNEFALTNKCGLTKRAPDWWGCAAKMGLHLAQTNSVKAVLSRPTHQRVTQTVGWLRSKIISNVSKGKIYGITIS
jgi:hypothetical protein